ncbi:MAG TPA: aromatic amino acid hydroxylase, partial [Polyangiaceae bacterium]|nr:aromatic amino acid hydroxylase [Polyangiaceae bacterium]
GLRQTGISVERIPSIAEMNDRLQRFGWGAVCVDGFIPPRAFTELQACGLLPIAADIRTREHLVYTPAPDIIHEAAGHAPILPDPGYAAYLRRFGEISSAAFTLPEEQQVFDAIYALSEIKEDPAATPEQLRGADAALEVALTHAREASEATRLSRLYWWTAEYGLVGRVDAYKIYGAGLLSSLWESHSCHDASVRKLPLDESCLDVSYDITRPQPQLFVARDFEALHELLDAASRTLASARGGAEAFEAALRSRETCSVRFSSGAYAIGTLRDVGASLKSPGWFEFEGRVRMSSLDIAGTEAFRESSGDAAIVFSGRLQGGHRLEDLALAPPSTRRRFCFESGASVEGTPTRAVRRLDEKLSHIELRDVTISLPGSPRRELPEFVLFAAGDALTARAGAVDPGFYSETEFTGTRVPKPRVFSEREWALMDLYEAASRAHRGGAAAVRADFPAIHRKLAQSFPDEWLLRWNLLESLLKADVDPSLRSALGSELEELELRFERKEPIASGLRYLSRLAAA